MTNLDQRAGRDEPSPDGRRPGPRPPQAHRVARVDEAAAVRATYRLLRVALAVIRLGPVLILGGLVVAMTLLSPGVPHHRQHRQRPRPDRGDRRARHRPAARDPHPRHRPLGRLDLALASVVGALVFEQAAAGRRLVIAVMLGVGRGRLRERRRLRVGPASPSVHHHPGHAEHRPGPRAAAVRRAARRGACPRSCRPSASGSFGWFPYSAFLVARHRLLVAVVLRPAGVGSLDLRRRRQPGGAPAAPASR